MEQNRWISFGNSNISTVELFNIASFMTGYEKAINLVVKNLRKEGYLKKNKKNVMLVSAINKSSDNKEEAKKLDSEKLAQIKTETNEAIKIRKLKCKAVYQTLKLLRK